ncbi:dihydroorotase [Elioraea sp. Yellowstone]|nr:dihydroorotase [Elioraea sp. Yellowstone]
MAAAHYDLIIRGGIAVLPWGEEATDIGVRQGRIAAFGVAGSAEADTVLDARGLHVLPGLIDAHVHLREPGADQVETIATGTRAAALGGLVAVFDMPNTKPAITDAGRLAWKRAHLRGRAFVDMGLYVGATKSNVAALAGLEVEPGVCAIKVFAGSSTGDLLVEDDASLEAVMRNGFRRIAYHSEDEYRLQARAPLFREGDPHIRHMEWRDVETAFLGTRRLMALARKTGRRAHILHVSTAEELSYLRDFRDAATVEVLVNHLTQWAPEVYERLKGFGVMNPPIRDRRHYEACWAAVRDGTVDVVASDHAPHPADLKRLPWPRCPAGLTGVQTIVPVMLDHVSAGRLSLSRLADLMCAGPARVYGVVGKGRLAAGYDADFTLVDMKRRRTITHDWIASPCGWTPFDGMAVTGWPVMTVLRGRLIMREDELIGEPAGELVRFGDTLMRAADA